MPSRPILLALLAASFSLVACSLVACSLAYDANDHIDSRERDPREGVACTPELSFCGEGLRCDQSGVCQACFHRAETIRRAPAQGTGPVRDLNISRGHARRGYAGSVWLSYLQDEQAQVSVSGLDTTNEPNTPFAAVTLAGLSTDGTRSIDFCHGPRDDYVVLSRDSNEVVLYRLPTLEGEQGTLVGAPLAINAAAAVFVGCQSQGLSTHFNPALLIFQFAGDARVVPLTVADEQIANIEEPGEATEVDPASSAGDPWVSDGADHVLLRARNGEHVLVGAGAAGARPTSARLHSIGSVGALGVIPDAGVVVAWAEQDHIALQRLNCEGAGRCSEGDWRPALARTGSGFDLVRAVALAASPHDSLTMVSLESSSDTGENVLAIRLLRADARPAHIPSWGSVVTDPRDSTSDAINPGDAVAALRFGFEGEVDSLLVAYEAHIDGAEGVRRVEVRSFQSCGTGPALEPSR